MTANGWLQIIVYSLLLLALTKPLGVYMLRVYDGTAQWLAPMERVMYRLCAITTQQREMMNFARRPSFHYQTCAGAQALAYQMLVNGR